MPVGYSPCLLDDMIADPELAWRVYQGIPKLEDHPRKDHPILGDLAKINGSVHYYNGQEWIECR